MNDEQLNRVRDALYEVVEAAIEVNMSPSKFIQELRLAWDEARRCQADREKRYLNGLQL